MHHVPEWVIKIVQVEKLKCNQCHRLLKLENLMSIGIQESSQQPHHDTLSIGMFCSKCNELTIFELKEMTLVDFAFEILDQETEKSSRGSGRVKRKRSSTTSSIKRNDENKQRSNRKKSKISLKEVEDSVNFLKSVKTHDEFLIAMGMSPEEIDKYNFKRTKPKK